MRDSPRPEQINVVYQFFIPQDKHRRREIQECLRRNAENKHVDSVVLMNEREYSPQELGLKNLGKVRQVVVGARLTFAETFRQLKENDIQGYIVMVNADIFVDATIRKLRYSRLDDTRSVMAQLRHEYRAGTPLSAARLFGPRFDSQDAWIVHSNQSVPEENLPLFKFCFGTPGCDNKLVYLFKILGYEVINDPLAVKIYHLHANMERNYQLEPLPPPWGLIVAAGTDVRSHRSSLGVNPALVYQRTNGFRSFSFTNDNILLGKYVMGRLHRGEKFVIPRIAGIENNYAVIGLRSRGRALAMDERRYVAQTQSAMKKNAGIQLTDRDSMAEYSRLYLDAFSNCEVYTGWEPWGSVYEWIADSHDEIRRLCPRKLILWAFAFDIFHYVKAAPWTWALKGRRVLIISSFADSMRAKDPLRAKIYGVDLFPECSLTFIKPPQTQADEPSRGFRKELDEFCEELDTLEDTYDVALVAAGGYGNLICNHIYKTGHSAIYVGGVLQMYFGIVGQRWLTERPDAVRCYINEHWTRPGESERPANFGSVERGCYW